MKNIFLVKLKDRKYEEIKIVSDALGLDMDEFLTMLLNHYCYYVLDEMFFKPNDINRLVMTRDVDVNTEEDFEDGVILSLELPEDLAYTLQNFIDEYKDENGNEVITFRAIILLIWNTYYYPRLKPFRNKQELKFINLPEDADKKKFDKYSEDGTILENYLNFYAEIWGAKNGKSLGQLFAALQFGDLWNQQLEEELNPKEIDQIHRVNVRDSKINQKDK